jgi:PAS domain S-box-containing protein
MTRSGRKSSIAARYGGALACVAGAVLLRAALGSELASRFPNAASLIACLVAARFFGLGPALVVIAAALVDAFLFGHRPEPGREILFVAMAGATVWIVEILQRAKARAEEQAQLAEDRLQELQRAAKRREEEERVSAQLRAIVETSEDAILSQDMDGVIRSWNLGAERIFGYTAHDALGKPIGILLPPGRGHEERDIVERIRHGGRVKHFATQRIRKDGREIHVSLTVSPIHDSGGRVVGASHISRDITEQMEFEEQMRQTQKLESLGVLAGGLAHDFNNLLTGIMGNASLAAGELRDPARMEQRIQEILQASERAALLIRQMLAYAGKGRFVVEALDLSAQVQEILPLLRTSVPRLIDLQLQLAPDLPAIAADRAQIQQVIMNLAINAAEAIEERPGTVTIATRSEQAGDDRQVVLEVRDSGIGMDEATRTRMFDPFFTTKFTGRGLGLAAVMGIIRGHQGTISVESEPGRGTICTVVFPASADVAQGEKAAIESGVRGYGNILVVDDEELVRKMARFTLERYGYTVEVAIDGREALASFAARPAEFAAVLLDLTMPGMSGEDVLRRMRELRMDVPVVLSSGFTESEAVRRFENLGLAGFLQKPYTATALAKKIKQAVRRPAARA